MEKIICSKKARNSGERGRRHHHVTKGTQKEGVGYKYEVKATLLANNI